MKKLLILVFITVFCSCGDRFNDPSKIDELKTLRIDQIKSLLPLTESNQKSKVAFYNNNGDEITFDFKLESDLKEKKVGSKYYFAEEISASYISASIDNYSLYFVGSGNYVDVNNSNLFIIAGINQFITSTSTLLSINGDGDPVLALYYDEIKLLDKEFTSVYSNRIDTTTTSFNELYYNSSFGVIGFRDNLGELFVIKEFLE